MRALLPSGVVRPLALAAVFVLLALVLPRKQEVPVIRVAFVGNSITFVNDLPRLMQALSPTLVQDSCLHGSLSFLTILTKGNGMYNKWSTKKALVTSDYEGSSYPVHDYGACTVPQLLFGYDQDLSQGNENGRYVNDGKNPCFEDPVYLQYLTEHYDDNPQWDFVVLNDQTKYPADYQRRRKSMLSLKSVYSNILRDIQARPVFLATHGYKTSEVNTSDVGDVPTFTSRVYYGYQQYAQTLAQYLPEEQAPLVAPVGLAFLVVWEEAHGLWKNKFFYDDDFHPSPYGTYLLACVLYATLYDRMPPANVALPDNMERLWSRARKMEINKGMNVSYPTTDEANYLWRVAQRVTMEGYLPESFLDREEVEALEEAEMGWSWSDSSNSEYYNYYYYSDQDFDDDDDDDS